MYFHVSCSIVFPALNLVYIFESQWDFSRDTSVQGILNSFLYPYMHIYIVTGLFRSLKVQILGRQVFLFLIYSRLENYQVSVWI